MIEFKKVYRQKDDIFVEILNAVRENKLTKDNIHILNKRLKTSFKPKTKDGYITLTTHNSQADGINQIQINQLKEKEFVFVVTIKDDFPESMYPAEEKMILKKGAQVMFLKNNTENKKYFNGKIGLIN